MGVPAIFALSISQSPTSSSRSSRRYPLTPPSVTTSVSRPELNRNNTHAGTHGSPSARAATVALLSKVAAAGSRRNSSSCSAPPTALPSPGLKEKHGYIDAGSHHHHNHHHQYAQFNAALEAAAVDEPDEEGEVEEQGDVSPRWDDAMRYWTCNNQRDGYVSFPDYERFFPTCAEQSAMTELHAVQQRAKT